MIILAIPKPATRKIEEKPAVLLLLVHACINMYMSLSSR